MSQTTATEPLRLIIVEDCDDDASLLLHELRRGGFDVTAERVETAERLTTLLSTDTWDLIISDYNLPQFSGPEALKIVRERDPDLPFVIVSGSVGDDLAVAAMKAGACDYLVKGQLSRLAPAVRRELADADRRRQRAKAEAVLHP